MSKKEDDDNTVNMGGSVLPVHPHFSIAPVLKITTDMLMMAGACPPCSGMALMTLGLLISRASMPHLKRESNTIQGDGDREMEFARFLVIKLSDHLMAVDVSDPEYLGEIFDHYYSELFPVIEALQAEFYNLNEDGSSKSMRH